MITIIEQTYKISACIFDNNFLGIEMSQRVCKVIEMYLCERNTENTRIFFNSSENDSECFRVRDHKIKTLTFLRNKLYR